MVLFKIIKDGSLKPFYFCCVLLAIIEVMMISTVNAQGSVSTYIDKKGILRWRGNKHEINNFGVHYALPFSSAYEGIKKLGLSPEKEIDKDVYHIARLGLSAYRIHLWDSEISDTLGNLLENDHLRLLDYTLMQMKKRNIKIIITPLTYYPTQETKYGFGQKYGKKYLFTSEAIQATERYLFQLMNHINPYTGIAYKSDPDIIAFELYNEPEHHGHTVSEVTPYINRLVKAVRKTGCKKPLFYCMSIAPHLRKGFLKADIQGGSSQWYPLSHNAGFEFKGNIFPFLDKWPKDSITNDIKASNKSLIAYEIDAADNVYAYSYPMIARTLRSVGFQFAAMFTYDPLGLGYANYEFRTHFMNLAYTPQKAIGLKIAKEVFDRIPRGMSFKSFPEDTVFDAFRLSHSLNLAEMVSEKKFIYTNSTTSKPFDLNQLEEITGYGSSSVITYEGKGAYFLDKLEDGVWRLEVMPDAVIVENPFANPLLNKEVVAIVWNTYPMTIHLSNLGRDFLVEGINQGNNNKQIAQDGRIFISPGTYILKRRGMQPKWTPNSRWKNIRLNEFVAPAATSDCYLLHHPLKEVSKGSSCEIKAEVISSQVPDSVLLQVTTLEPRKLRPIKFKRTSRYGYVAMIPEALLAQEDILNYQIIVKNEGKTQVFPENVEGNYVNFTNTKMYVLRVVEKDMPICLLDVEKDCIHLRRSHRHYRYVFHPSLLPNKLGIELSGDNLRYTSHYVKEEILGRKKDLESKKSLEIRGKSLSKYPVKAWVVLQLANGMEFGNILSLKSQELLYNLSLDELKPVRVIGPGERGKVSVEPSIGKSHFDIKEIETIKVILSPDLNVQEDRIVIEYALLI